VVELRQVCTFGLGVIKDDYGPEAEGGLLSDSLALLPPAAVTDHRRENLDALFAFLDESAQLLPFAESRHTGGSFERLSTFDSRLDAG
jgi:hypothetical protein